MQTERNETILKQTGSTKLVTDYPQPIKNYNQTHTSTKMSAEKKQILEAAGWKVGTVAEFLGLSPEEEAIIESRYMDEVYFKNREKYPEPNELW